MSPKTPMRRLFVAVDLPEELRKKVRSLVKKVPGASISNPDQYHITLRFLGDTEESLIPDIRSALSGIARDRFELFLSGVGFFPKRSNPRVFWLGVAGLGPLRELKDDIDTALDAVGLPDREKREFSPHLTIARLGESFRRDGVPALEKPFAAFGEHPFTVASFRLYSSMLASTGAVHSVEEEYPLK